MNREPGANTVPITNFVMQLKDNTTSGAIACRDDATIFAARFTAGFNRFVTSTVAPVASGWSRLPGGIFTHWESAALSRRTPKADVNIRRPNEQRSPKRQKQ